MEKQTEKILKIINKEISTYQLKDDSDPIMISGKEGCAKAIASLYEGWYPGEFLKDCIDNAVIFDSGEWLPDGAIGYKGAKRMFKTLPALFKWWQDNVEGK